MVPGYAGLLRALGMTRLGCRFRLTLKPGRGRRRRKDQSDSELLSRVEWDPMSMPDE